MSVAPLGVCGLGGCTGLLDAVAGVSYKRQALSACSFPARTLKKS